MIQQHSIGSLTEIYTVGGVITQSTPTNFHTFYTRKILTPTENISDFKEITAAQRATLEASDAAWNRPPQHVIDDWNLKAGAYGRYNESTGFFELNGILDITYKEALEILALSHYGALSEDDGKFRFLVCYSKELRTVMPVYVHNVNCSWLFGNQSKLEVVRIGAYGNLNNRWSVKTTMERIFEGCAKLKTVYGLIDATAITENNSMLSYQLLPELETINLKIKQGIKLQSCPKLSYESVKFLVDNAANTTAITVTVHATVMAKLSGDTEAEAYTSLTDEEKTAWTALVAAAAEKNITFATA